MKKSLLLPLALAALLSACGAPDSTSEVSIDYENQFYATTGGQFLHQQRCELDEMDALLDCLSTLEDTPEARGYLQGYLDGISGNVSGRLSAYYTLWAYAPKATVPQMLPDGLTDPYYQYSNARTSFLDALWQNCDSPLLTDAGSPFRTKLPQLQDAFGQLYDLSIITHDWQAEKYIQDLDAFTLLLAEATALLAPNTAADLSSAQ